MAAGMSWELEYGAGSHTITSTSRKWEERDAFGSASFPSFNIGKVYSP